MTVPCAALVRPVGARPGEQAGDHVLWRARRRWRSARSVGAAGAAGSARQAGRPGRRVGAARPVRPRPGQDRRPRHRAERPLLADEGTVLDLVAATRPARAAQAAAHRAAARCYIEEHLTDPAWARSRSRPRSASASASSPGYSPPTARRSPGTSSPAACSSPTPSWPPRPPGVQRRRDRGRRRRPLRLHFRHLLLARVPPGSSVSAPATSAALAQAWIPAPASHFRHVSA